RHQPSPDGQRLRMTLVLVDLLEYRAHLEQPFERRALARAEMREIGRQANRLGPREDFPHLACIERGIGLGHGRHVSGKACGENQRGEGDPHRPAPSSNRLETEVSSAIRRTASPIKGATVSIRMRDESVVASVGRIVSVITSSVRAELSTRATAPPDNTPWVM